MLRVLSIPAGLLVILIGSLIWSGGGVEKRADFAFINRGDIITLDLNQMSYLQDFRLTYAIREGLYGLDARTYQPIPAGATHYDLSDDKRVWTFHLRPQCRWTNGDPVTAGDYVFSWRRMLEEPGEYTYLFYYIKNAREYETSYTAGRAIPFSEVGIEAVDDLTFRVTLTNPVPYMLDLVAFPPFYPRHQQSMEPFKVPQKDGKYTYRSEYTRPPHVVTNGPFVLKRWDFKRRLRLVKSETYWDKTDVKCETIEMVVDENALSQFLQYEAGSVDWLADVSADLSAEMRDKGRTDLRISPAFGTGFLTFRCAPQLAPSLGGGKNPLSDVRVRKALAQSIDKQFIVHNITRMGEQPATTYVPPDGTLVGYRSLPGLPYDVELARTLLAEAGYPGGRGFPVLPILYNTNSTARAKIVQFLKNQWKQKLNIDVEIQGLEGKTYRDRISAKDYAIAPVAWYGDYPDASTFTDKYKSTSLQNDALWVNMEYDDLCAAADREPDPDKRLRLLERAEHLLNTEVPIVPLYHYVNTSLSRDNVRGVEPNPRNLTIFKGVWVERK